METNCRSCSSGLFYFLLGCREKDEWQAEEHEKSLQVLKMAGLFLGRVFFFFPKVCSATKKNIFMLSNNQKSPDERMLADNLVADNTMIATNK